MSNSAGLDHVCDLAVYSIAYAHGALAYAMLYSGAEDIFGERWAEFRQDP